MYEVCKSMGKLRFLFGFSIAMFAMMVLWVPVVDLESATGVVVVMNLVGATLFGALSGTHNGLDARMERGRLYLHTPDRIQIMRVAEP